MTPGHEVVGVVREGGHRFPAGTRVGVPWLAWTCGRCEYCTSGRENLCEQARFTGRDIDGGFADYAVADGRFCFPIPAGYEPAQAAPLLCAGLIGYRSLRMCGSSGTCPKPSCCHTATWSSRMPGRERDGSRLLCRNLSGC